MEQEDYMSWGTVLYNETESDKLYLYGEEVKNAKHFDEIIQNEVSAIEKLDKIREYLSVDICPPIKEKSCCWWRARKDVLEILEGE